MIASILALALVNASAWTLSANGLGPIRIGMSESMVARLIGGTIEDDRVSTDDYQACHEASVVKLPDVFFLFEHGRLSRVTLTKRRDIHMRDGIGIGASERQLRQRYGGRLSISPADYDAPGHSLLAWEQPKKRGLRFLTDAQGRIQTIHAGASSIELIEDCL